jgi:hypothetical protein
MHAPCQAGTLLVPPSSVIDRLEVVDSDCHQGAQRAMDRFTIHYCSLRPDRGEKLASNN